MKNLEKAVLKLEKDIKNVETQLNELLKKTHSMYSKNKNHETRR